VEGNGLSRRPEISSDARYVTFESEATNLGGTGAFRQIFRKDLQTGAIMLVSANAAGAEANKECGHPSMTPDGRYVSFHTGASNLLPAATGATTQVFRKDLSNGGIVLVSCNSSGEESNAKSRYSTITPNGRYVSFLSWASNLAPAAGGLYEQVFQKDLQTGEVKLVSSSREGWEGNGVVNSYGPSPMSPDGRYVAFGSYATNLVPAASGGLGPIFRKDLISGEVVLVSCNTSGFEANGPSWRPAMTANGRYVTFYSPPTNLVADATGAAHE